MLRCIDKCCFFYNNLSKLDGLELQLKIWESKFQIFNYNCLSQYMNMSLKIRRVKWYQMYSKFCMTGRENDNLLNVCTVKSHGQQSKGLWYWCKIVYSFVLFLLQNRKNQLWFPYFLLTCAHVSIDFNECIVVKISTPAGVQEKDLIFPDPWKKYLETPDDAFCTSVQS